MIAVNIGSHCLIYSGLRTEVQSALSGVEIGILRLAHGQTISALAIEMGLAYSHVYAMSYRLQHRGLIKMHRNGCGLEISALADVLEDA